ncbi:39S ribosomal protein L55, mitochondrial [Colletes gigas]|uniref:39S ribosomal protein L55, mitochondrial n=1 Tax=Colletes gigas TaxID=935657 RepID=UPI001C9AC81E|nr:39S ribosomal protein L55, mitochondrial [Colletes gigas]
MNASLLLRSTQIALSIRRNLNCWTAAITKKHRKIYMRTYPTHLILSDGSSINIEYDVPRMIIKLPLDMDTISEEQRKIRVAARKPLSKIEVLEEIDDNFDEFEYIRMNS